MHAYHGQQIPLMTFSGKKRHAGLLLVNSSKAPHPDGSVICCRSDHRRITRVRRHVINALMAQLVSLSLSRPSRTCTYITVPCERLDVFALAMEILMTWVTADTGLTSNTVPSFTSYIVMRQSSPAIHRRGRSVAGSFAQQHPIQ